MELFKLVDDTWLPGPTIDNWSSLVWSERYRDAGDFVLTMEDDISIMVDLPLGCLISHTDTREVMIVENHEIERNDDKKLIVTVTGRSFETFLENRVTPGTRQPAVDGFGDAIVEIVHATPAFAAMYLIGQALEPGTATVADEIALFSTFPDMRVAGTSLDTQIQRGDTYSAVIGMVQLADAGLKTIRGEDGFPYLEIIIHDGNDFTDSVIFKAQTEDLKDAHYFWTVKDYKNYAQVDANIYYHEYRTSDLPGDVTGLDRRLMYVDAKELEGAYIFGSSDQVVARRAQEELAQHRQLQLMQATISETAKPKFKINYDVGDLVFVYGEFGVNQVMRVTEHILTQDSEGLHGYPSLTAL